MPKVAAECGERVGRGVVTFPCHLPKEHDGPCEAPEKPESMAQRKRWLSGESARAVLAETQGPAQTTAQRYTENPTPVPGSQREAPTPSTHPVEGGMVARPTAPPFQRQPDTVDVAGCPRCRGEGTILVDGAWAEAAGAQPGDDPVFPPRSVCPVCRGSGDASPSLAAEPSAPSKQRPGDQPLPTVNERPFVQHVVISDIEARIALGVERYGTPLQTFNGRNGLVDAYEEALDLAIYLRQVVLEREEAVKALDFIETYVVVDSDSARQQYLPAFREALDTLRAVFAD